MASGTDIPYIMPKVADGDVTRFIFKVVGRTDINTPPPTHTLVM